MLGAGGVQRLVVFLVVGLLEEDVGADAGVFQLLVVLYRGGGDVDVHAPDGAVFMLDAVDGLDAFQNVLDGVVDGVLAGLQGQALVAHVLQGDDFGPDFLLGEFFPRDVLVLMMVGAVDAAVHAVVGKVEGREEDDAVAVEVFFDLLRQGVDLLRLLGQFAGQENGGLTVGQAFEFLGFLDDAVYERGVVLVFVGVFEGSQNFLVVDEFIRVR